MWCYPADRLCRNVQVGLADQLSWNDIMQITRDEPPVEDLSSMAIRASVGIEDHAK
jgi:hypothetical protein